MVVNNVTIRLLVSNYLIYKHKLLRAQPTFLSTVGVGLIILWLRGELISEVNLAHPHYIHSTRSKTSIDFIRKVFVYFQLLSTS
jgi:hypothetical protein